jgi:hypothetical protein
LRRGFSGKESGASRNRDTDNAGKCTQDVDEKEEEEEAEEKTE